MTDTPVQVPSVEPQAAENKTEVPTITNESTIGKEETKNVSEGITKDEPKTSDSIAQKEEKKVDEESKTNGSAAQSEDIKKTEPISEKKSDHRRDDRGSNRGDRNGRGRGTYKDRNSRDGRIGSKFDPSSAKETDDPVEIRKQVEFYFSDSNLPNDKFLFEAIGGSKNNAVPIETIHSFKRMRRFQPFSAVVAALKESSTLDIVQDDTAIRRKIPLGEGTGSTQPEIQKVFEDQSMSRTIYVKGFGVEAATTQFDIEAWFSKYGATNQVRLRRTTQASFKGSVFVEFESEEAAKQFLTLDPAPEYDDKTLIIKSKKQYCDDKVDDLNAGVIRPKAHDERDWNARRESDRKNGFPSLHKDSRDKRDRRGGQKSSRSRGGRGGNRDRDSRGRNDHNNRDNDRDDRSDNDEKAESKDSAKPVDKKTEDSTEAATNEKNSKAPKVNTKKNDEALESKKRERTEDEKEDTTPAVKKSAVESEMTGGPEAVGKKADE